MAFERKNLYRLAPLLIPALAISLYINTFNNPFVIDDIPYIVENYQIRRISKIWSSFMSPFPPDSPSQGLYRPLTNISFGVDYFFWKLDPRGYHLSNAILHGLASLGLFHLAKSLAPPGITPWVAALIFAAHPVHTEAVAWVVGRAEVMAALFYFLAFWFYIKVRSKSEVFDPINLSLSATAYFAAMLSKEMALSLPIAIFLYELARPGGGLTSAIGGFKRLYLPYVAVIILYIVLKLMAVGRLGPEPAQQPLLGLSPFFRALFIGRVFLYYLKLSFFPSHLSVDYPLNIGAGTFFTYTLSFGGLIILALVVFAPLMRGAAFRMGAGFMGIWFAASLSPVLNIFPIGATIADRFLYLPLGPFALGCAIAANKAGDMAKGMTAKKRLLAATLVLIVLALYSAMTLQRNSRWSSEGLLWAETARLNPASFMARNGLGIFYLKSASLDKAMAAFTEALALKGNYAAAHNNAGVIYEKKGFADRALFKYKIALRKDFNYSLSIINLAGVYFAKGLYELAASHYERVILENPNNPMAHKNLGVIYLYKLKSPLLARRHLNLSLTIDPDQADAAIIRQVLASLGDSGPSGDGKSAREYNTGR